MQVQSSFFGPWVVRATFVMAMFGWGVGFYGPSIFLYTVVQRTGWSLPLVSTAVTVHYLFGAFVVARLPVLHRRFGVGPTAVLVFAKTPGRLGQQPDGDAPDAVAASVTSPNASALPGLLLWSDRGFLTLALGMAAGLFAQIGLLAHLFALLVPSCGAQVAGLAMGFATACAIGGRLIVAGVLSAGVNRRAVAALAYVVQLAGSMVLLFVNEQQTVLILLGVALFGSGIGNATSIPPLIAQVEFVKEDVPRVVALIVAMGQAAYAFAPAVFGLVLSTSTAVHARIGLGTSTFFVAVAAVQGISILCFLAGRRWA